MVEVVGIRVGFVVVVVFVDGILVVVLEGGGGGARGGGGGWIVFLFRRLNAMVGISFIFAQSSLSGEEGSGG